MSQLIDAAVAKKPTGLVVSIPNAEALSPSIKKAIDAGIPVVSMNSGSDVFKDLGIKAHVGQTEFQAGLGAGERFKAAGVKNAVCFNQEVGNQALTLRCNGFFTGLGLADPSTGKVLTGKISDPAAHAGHDRGGAPVRPDDRRHPDPRPVRRRSRRSTPSPPRASTVHLATFDLSADVLTAIKDGKMDFAIDQQQFLQGYLPIVILTNYARDPEPPDRRRHGADHDRPGLRHQGRRRGRHRARREGPPLT